MGIFSLALTGWLTAAATLYFNSATRYTGEIDAKYLSTVDEVPASLNDEKVAPKREGGLCTSTLRWYNNQTADRFGWARF
jgi:hypothetical protein